ncbi:RDD family protein [Propionicimonas sp.]|uniref:RDD family protein n=1 Tax=Propionicimonas sp. TaxID=1955623 RepID=UPI0039E6452F
MASAQTEEYPGSSIGLPEAGAGSLASWFSRIAALILDWGVCMVVAVFLFGTGVLTGGGWRAWMVLTVFFVESAVLGALAGGSFGQLIAGIGIARLDGERLGWLRALARAAMICLVLPTVVIGAERRALNDLVLGTVVVNRRARSR